MTPLSPLSTEDPAAATPAVPLSDKAEWWLTFKATSASLADGVVTFEPPKGDGEWMIKTTVGDVKLADAFAPGRVGPDAKADGVVTGKTMEGDKDVLTVIRFSEPEFKDGVLTAKAAPVNKGDMPTLTDGEVQKALANDRFVPMSPELKTASLSDVQITLDSRAAPGARADGKAEIPSTVSASDPGTPQPAAPPSAEPAAAEPAAAAGRRLLYAGNVATGAIIGSAACGGSVVCAAVGANVAYHNQWHHHHHHCCW